MRRSIIFIAAFAFGLMTSVSLPNPLLALDHAARQFSASSLAFIHRTLTPVQAETAPIDANAAARINEDLDWRMSKTPDLIRAFLARYPHGVHASEAQAKLAEDDAKSHKLTQDKAGTASEQTPKFSFSPVIEVANAPPKPPDLGVFAALEQPPAPAPETKTIVRWREPRTQYVTHWRYQRPRHVARRSPWPPFFAWFGPRDPRDWRGY